MQQMPATDVARPIAPNASHSFYRAHNQYIFTLQLEFLSSLASPSYLTHLSRTPCPSTNDLLPLTSSPVFLRYVAHLLAIWRDDERLAKFVRHPHCFLFAEALVKSKFFRDVVVRDEGWEARASMEMVKAWAKDTESALREEESKEAQRET